MKSEQKSQNSQDKTLTDLEQQRYSRQLILPGFGYESQVILKNTKVLIIGAGGICSSAAFYLAGAGVGTIGLIDADKVEISNLHRQIIHTTQREGMPKAQSAKKMLQAFNPLINVNTYIKQFNSQNAVELASKYDIILDASDNARTHYLANDASYIAKKPLVAGTAIRWDGQITVFHYNSFKQKIDDDTKKSPCYRCLFPKPTPPQLMEGCSDSGVLGVIPGLVGQLEALEAVKIALSLNQKQILSKRMILFDGRNGKFRQIKLRDWKEDCQLCGKQPTITKINQFNYSKFCPTFCEHMESVIIPAQNNISVDQLKKIIEDDEKQCSEKYKFIDVRPTLAYDYSKINQVFQNVPMPLFGGKIPQYLQNDKDKTFIIVCRAGNDSKRATLKLLDAGLKNVKNVIGGILQYKMVVNPDLKVI